MILLKEVLLADKDKLWNIFQKYFYEMSAYYDMDMDECGNYPYPYFEHYFVESERTALFLYDDETLIGFAMLNQYSCLGNIIDHAIAEFTIFPPYRKKHLGLEAVRKIFAQYPGRWEIKYSKENQAAESFWTKAVQPYHPMVAPWESTEIVLSFVVE